MNIYVTNAFKCVLGKARIDRYALSVDLPNEPLIAVINGNDTSR